MAFPAHRTADARRAALPWRQAERWGWDGCPSDLRDPPSGRINAVGAHVLEADRFKGRSWNASHGSVSDRGSQLPKCCARARTAHAPWPRITSTAYRGRCSVAVIGQRGHSTQARACECSAQHGRNPRAHNVLVYAVPSTASMSSGSWPKRGQLWRPIQSPLLMSMSPPSPSPPPKPSASAGTGPESWPMHGALEPFRVRSTGRRRDLRAQLPRRAGCR